MEHNISHDTRIAHDAHDSINLRPDGTIPPLPSPTMKLPRDKWYTWGFTKNEPRIVDEAGNTICIFENNIGETDAEMKERAEFIVRAGNTHDALVTLVEQLSDDVGHYLDCPARHGGECDCIQSHIFTVLKEAKG
jgi:hypothetical protein